MRLLVCASEYYPYGSGIANVAYNIVEKLKVRNLECTVCSPNGPDIRIKSKVGYGRLSLLQYWHKMGHYLKEKSDLYDILWLHNPLFLTKIPFDKQLITMHITSHGVYQRVKQSQNYSLNLKLYKRLNSSIEKYSLEKMKLNETRFTAVSRQVCEELDSLSIPKKNISYIPNGVDTDLFKPISNDKKLELRKKFGIPEQNLILLSTGNLNVVKNPLKLIEIYADIEKKEKNITLVMAGKGSLERASKELAIKLGIKSIVFLGHINYKNIHNLYACSDAYIMTSAYEGLPLTLLEALSSGLPCIVSNVSSISSMVTESNSGLTINTSNKGESVDKIISFLEEDISELGKNGREYAVNKLDWNIISERYLQEFKKIYYR